MDLEYLKTLRHLSIDDVPSACFMSYLEFNKMSKTMSVILHEYDSFKFDDNFFILSWASHRDPVHFVVYPDMVYIINGEDLFSHLQELKLESVHRIFQLSIEYLLEELQQICTGVQFDIMGIQDLVMLLDHLESQDLLLRIKNTQTAAIKLKNSIRTKRALIQRCNMRMYNTTTQLILLEDTLNHHLDDLDIHYDHYIGEINVSLAMSSHKVNLIIRKLTIITIAGLPMIVVAGMWGMNTSALAYGVPGNYIDGSWYIVFFSSMLFSILTGYLSDKYI